MALFVMYASLNELAQSQNTQQMHPNGDYHGAQDKVIDKSCYFVVFMLTYMFLCRDPLMHAFFYLVWNIFMFTPKLPKLFKF